MIELQMARRMALRGLACATLLVVFLWAAAAPGAAASGAIGIAMTVANLWLSGRLIGGIAESNPHLLAAAGLGALLATLGAFTALALALRSVDVLSFRVAGLTLVGGHLVLVLWETVRTLAPLEPRPTNPPDRRDDKELVHGT